jgi:hypothetical protein
VEESICHEEHEVLNDIHYDRNNIETSGIISDIYVVLSVHEDQHVSSEYPNVEEQVYSAKYFSPDYEAEIDEKLAAKAREDSSMFFHSFSESKAEFVFLSYKEYAEDISILQTDVLGNPTYDEEVILYTGREQTTCDGYPSEDDEEQSSPMVHVYYDCEYDPSESHEGEKEEPNE